MNQRLQIFFPGKLVFGNGTLAQLADEVLLLNPSKVFIATIAPLQQALAGFIGELEKHEVQTLVDTSI